MEKMETGMDPVKRLLVKEMTRRFLSDPSWGGMGPVTMPGKRMSWVNSVKFAREAGREPARPSESERPVPSVRVVMRRWLELVMEQVMPEKEEQGSEEWKFQEEKKGEEEEGMSVSVFLMSYKTDKSEWLRNGGGC